MAAGKLIVVAFGLLLVLSIGGFFGPSPLVPGLGPVFDHVVPLALFLVLAFAAGPWLLRFINLFPNPSLLCPPPSGRKCWCCWRPFLTSCSTI